MTKYKVNLIYTDNSESLDSIFIKVITKELDDYFKSLFLVLQKAGTENER